MDVPDKAVRRRKINLRAKVSGFDRTHKHWRFSYPNMPPFMAFDIDADKEWYYRLFPDYECFDIHDALDIPRPLVTTINPISGNCQFIYKMRWSWDDWNRFQANEKEFLAEYDEVRKTLSWLLGSDPEFKNHVVRSPMFIAGWHRKHPNRRTNSGVLIELGTESLYHQSIWYNPVAYSLDDLKALAEDLTELHIKFLGNEAVLNETKPRYFRNLLKLFRVPEPKEQTESKVPRISREEALAIDPTTVQEGSRNNSLFDYTRHKVKDRVHRFRSANDVEGFLKYTADIALGFNSNEPVPQSESEVMATVRSIVSWYMSQYSLSSEVAKELNEIRWWEHVPAWKEAQEQNVSSKTIYRRRIRISQSYDMDVDTKPSNRYCTGCGTDISLKRKQAKFCSDECRKAHHYETHSHPSY
jgi:Primase C terminal 1 (PriCT-1)